MFDLKNIPLPRYTRNEDIANCITHALGVPFCIVAAVLLFKLHVSTKAAALQFVATCLYIFSTLVVFVGSAVYHGLKPSRKKQIARIIDHSNIYFMISGTVTAFAIPTMNELNKAKIIAVVCIVWALSIIGILMTFMDFKRFAIPQIFMYVIMGWTAVIGMRSVYYSGEAGKKFAMMVLIGGACITAGTILYLIGKKHRYFHAVFHTCVLAGSIVIFTGIYNFNTVLFIK